MIVHTASWRLVQAHLACGHTASVRSGEHSAYCSWCARTVPVDRTVALGTSTDPADRTAGLGSALLLARAA